MSVTVNAGTVPSPGLPAAKGNLANASLPSLTMTILTLIGGVSSGGGSSAVVFNPHTVPIPAGTPVFLYGPDSGGAYYVGGFGSSGQFAPASI